MGFGQMEGRFQGPMDLCQGYPQRLPSSYQVEVCSIQGYSTVVIMLNFSRSNTQERKPVTNSRDTQELLPEAGQEMLRIFHTHPARTSLLQDFAFYEVGHRIIAI